MYDYSLISTASALTDSGRMLVLKYFLGECTETGLLSVLISKYEIVSGECVLDEEKNVNIGMVNKDFVCEFVAWLAEYYVTPVSLQDVMCDFWYEVLYNRQLCEV